MTFKEYLKQSRYYSQDSIRGDLAYDIVRDKRLRDEATIEEVSSYLEGRLDKAVYQEFLVLHRAYLKAQSNK